MSLQSRYANQLVFFYTQSRIPSCSSLALLDSWDTRSCWSRRFAGDSAAVIIAVRIISRFIQESLSLPEAGRKAWTVRGCSS